VLIGEIRKVISTSFSIKILNNLKCHPLEKLPEVSAVSRTDIGIWQQRLSLRRIRYTFKQQMLHCPFFCVLLYFSRSCRLLLFISIALGAQGNNIGGTFCFHVTHLGRGIIRNMAVSVPELGMFTW